MYNEFSVPHEVLESHKFKDLKISTKLFYCYLAKLKNRYADNRGWFWRSMETLSEDTGLNLRTLKRAKKELIRSGFIEVDRSLYKATKKRAPDNYKLNGYVIH